MFLPCVCVSRRVRFAAALLLLEKPGWAKKTGEEKKKKKKFQTSGSMEKVRVCVGEDGKRGERAMDVGGEREGGFVLRVQIENGVGNCSKWGSAA